MILKHIAAAARSFYIRLMHKIGIYSYRPDIKGDIVGKRGEVSKKNQKTNQKTQ